MLHIYLSTNVFSGFILQQNCGFEGGIGKADEQSCPHHVPDATERQKYVHHHEDELRVAELGRQEIVLLILFNYLDVIQNCTSYFTRISEYLNYPSRDITRYCSVISIENSLNISTGLLIVIEDKTRILLRINETKLQLWLLNNNLPIRGDRFNRPIASYDYYYYYYSVRRLWLMMYI